LLVALIGLGATCLAHAAGGRATVAVVPFDNKAGINPVTVDTLVDMITTAIVKSQKFEVIERDAIGRLMDEQNFGASGAVEAESAAKMGKIKGADFLVIGVVTEAGASAKATAAYGVVTEKSSVSLAIDIRFAESTTGQTRFAETFRETRGGVSFQTDSSGTFSVTQGPGGEMARALIDKIVAKILIAVYPPKIVKVETDSGNVILNYGDVLMTPGDEWVVMSLGEELVDPDTGESLGSSETKTGKIQITRADAKVSHAVIVDGTAAVGDVCRREAKKPSSAAPPRKKVDPF
jgi:curli biogenesis system outer membrane secretion channel CsgG